MAAHSLNMNEKRKRGEFCDFEIKASGKTFPVHRLVLGSSASEYFQAIFASNTQESDQGFCEVDEVEPDVVEICIEFLYIEKLEINAEKAVNVLKLSHLWKVNKAGKICEEMLVKNLSMKHSFEYWRLAQQYDLKNLFHHCNNYIFSHIQLFTDTTELVDLSLSELQKLILEKEGRECNSKDLWSLCVKWGFCNSFGQFCNIVREFSFDEILIPDFKGMVLGQSHIKECNKCKEIACTKFLGSITSSSDITVENCLFLKSIANIYNCELQQNIIRTFIVNNYKAVFLRPDFQILPNQDDILEYIKCLTKDKWTTAEFSAIISWMKYDQDREETFQKLFNNMKYAEESFNFLLGLFNLDDILFIRKLAERYSCATIGWSANKYIMDNFPDVIKLPEALQLPEEQLTTYLKNPTSYGKEPVQIWQFILKWINFNIAERKIKFPQIFQALQLKLFTTEFIQESICKNELVKESNDCLSHLIGYIFNNLTTKNQGTSQNALMTNSEIKEKQIKLEKAVEKIEAEVSSVKSTLETLRDRADAPQTRPKKFMLTKKTGNSTFSK